jgi:WD40 repeat protein
MIDKGSTAEYPRVYHLPSGTEGMTMRVFIFAAALFILAGCGEQPSSTEGGSPIGSRPKPAPPAVRVGGAAFSGDGKLLLVSYHIDFPDPKARMPKPLALWDVGSGKKLWAAGDATAEQFWPVAFLPDCKTVLLKKLTRKGRVDSLELWDVKAGKPLRGFAEIPKDDLVSAALSGDGKAAVVSIDHASPQLWDVGSGKLVREFDKTVLGACGPVAVSPDGKWALIAGRGADLWDVATGKLGWAFEQLEDGEPPIAFAPDSKSAILGKYDPEGKKHHLVLVEVPSGKVVREFDLWGEPISISADGRRLAVGRYEQDMGKEVKFTHLDLATGRMLANKEFGSFSRPTFAFSPDGHLAFTGIVIGNNVMELRLWDLAKGELVRQLDDSPWTLGQ